MSPLSMALRDPRGDTSSGLGAGPGGGVTAANEIFGFGLCRVAILQPRREDCGK